LSPEVVQFAAIVRMPACRKQKWCLVARLWCRMGHDVAIRTEMALRPVGQRDARSP
jgi:hypothetical protein